LRYIPLVMQIKGWMTSITAKFYVVLLLYNFKNLVVSDSLHLHFVYLQHNGMRFLRIHHFYYRRIKYFNTMCLHVDRDGVSCTFLAILK
jgi:hypothetical protein